MTQSTGECLLKGKEFSELVGRIYDASLDPEHWPSVLSEVAEYVSGPAAMIFWQDASTRTGQRVFSHGDDPGFTEAYFNYYIKISPAIAIQHTFPVGEVRAMSDIFSSDQVVNTRFYREWMKPQAYIDNVFSVLDRTASSYATVAVARSDSDGLVDEQARNRMQALVPHIRRSVLIGKIIDLHQARSEAFSSILDQVPAAVFSLDRRGRVVHANGSGVELMQQGHLLAQDADRLVPVVGKAQPLFEEFCAAAALGDMEVGNSGVIVSLAGADEQDYVAHLLPLKRRNSSGLEVVGDAVAAVFVRRAGLELKTPVELAARKYALTSRETQVLHHVLETETVAKIAEVLGIGEATVKTHLNHIFNKTGVRRRSDLIMIVSSLAGGLGC